MAHFKVTDMERARFHEKIDRNSGDCWLWTGSRDGQGYGMVKIGARSCRVHRLAYTLYVGPIPVNLIVRHACDVPSCCNPSHLLLGTRIDNNRDRVERGRSAIGERSGSAKLADREVIEIRASTEPVDVLAKRYDITIGHVYKLRRDPGLRRNASPPLPASTPTAADLELSN